MIAVGWAVYQKIGDSKKGPKRGGDRLPVPVEVAPITHGSIELQRSFSGTLEARSEFVVAPKVSGRVEKLNVDLADMVVRDQVVAELDDAEYVQAVASAEANLALEKANHDEAHSLLDIANRELERLQRMRERGDISESQLDTARSEQVVKRAQVEVTQARIKGAEADLAAARVRLGYTKVAAGWHGGSDQRVVAERFVDAGETVAANAPLLRIVELNPITAVFFITERDYALLNTDQQAVLTTDAFPGMSYHGSVKRIAPVFRESTRQARVELLVDNPDLQLKPGMFTRATVTLKHQEDAVIIPELALTKRDEQDGVFLVSPDGKTVKWQPIKTGIRHGSNVEVVGVQLQGQVVVLGQQQLDDGSTITIVGSGK